MSKTPQLNNFLNKLMPNREQAMLDKRCVVCGENFSEKNVHTDAGWRETEISGMCENCWKEIFSNEN